MGIIASSDLQEDVIWRDDVRPLLGQLPENVLDIWRYGFTEMFNNVIDHSDAAQITVLLRKTAISTDVWVMDDGVGIFKKIQAALNLLDQCQYRHRRGRQPGADC